MPTKKKAARFSQYVCCVVNKSSAEVEDLMIVETTSTSAAKTYATTIWREDGVGLAGCVVQVFDVNFIPQVRWDPRRRARKGGQR